MASQYPTSIGSVSGLPLATALAIIPTLPRPLLNRLVERAIEHMDQQDGDPDLEPDNEREDDDPPEAEDFREWDSAPFEWRQG